MTDQELKDIRQIVAALKRVEWSGPNGHCPVCNRAKAYGMHPCSCPIRLAQRAGDRLLGGAAGLCAWPAGCESPAVTTAIGYAPEDQRYAPPLEYDRFRGQNVLAVCEEHGRQLEERESPEYLTECPSCGCHFGVG
jgi:hypothetical protein